MLLQVFKQLHVFHTSKEMNGCKKNLFYFYKCDYIMIVNMFEFIVVSIIIETYISMWSSFFSSNLTSVKLLVKET